MFCQATSSNFPSILGPLSTFGMTAHLSVYVLIMSYGISVFLDDANTVDCKVCPLCKIGVSNNTKNNNKIILLFFINTRSLHNVFWKFKRSYFTIISWGVHRL